MKDTKAITKVKACGGEMVGNERVLLADQSRKSGSFPRLDLICCGQYQYHSGSW